MNATSGVAAMIDREGRLEIAVGHGEVVTVEESAARSSMNGESEWPDPASRRIREFRGRRRRSSFRPRTSRRSSACRTRDHRTATMRVRWPRRPGRSTNRCSAAAVDQGRDEDVQRDPDRDDQAREASPGRLRGLVARLVLDLGLVHVELRGQLRPGSRPRRPRARPPRRRPSVPGTDLRLRRAPPSGSCCSPGRRGSANGRTCDTRSPRAR